MEKLTLKAARRHRALTQDALAALTGIDQTTISGIECGRRGASVDVQKRLEKALRLTGRITFTPTREEVQAHDETQGATGTVGG